MGTGGGFIWLVTREILAQLSVAFGQRVSKGSGTPCGCLDTLAWVRQPQGVLVWKKKGSSPTGVMLTLQGQPILILLPQAVPEPHAATAGAAGSRPTAVAAAGAHSRRAGRQQRQQEQQALETVPAVSAWDSNGSPSRQPHAVAFYPGPAAPKPPDGWRQGEPTGFPSPPRTRAHQLRRSAGRQPTHIAVHACRHLYGCLLCLGWEHGMLRLHNGIQQCLQR